jgi:hypothetical protein
MRSPTGFLVVSGVEVTATIRGCNSRLLLLLGAVVGAGPRLAVASSGTLESFCRSRKQVQPSFQGTGKAWLARLCCSIAGYWV